MTRNLKALGLALVAMLAMSAMAVSAANAEVNGKVTAESSPVTMDGKQTTEQKFTRGAVPVTCANATFHAQSNTGDNTITVTPTYSSCHATGPFGETWPVTVTMSGCDYMFHLTNTKGTFTAISDVVCPVGASITVDVYTSHNNHTANTTLCKIHVPAQTGLKTITLTNQAAGGTTPKNWVSANINITGITSTRTGSALCGAEHSATSALHGGAELKGTTVPGGAANGVTIS